MGHNWQKIIPRDPYTVASNGLLHEYDRKILTLLYQPLIGPIAFSLYMTLWSQVEENRLWSKSNSHYGLMEFMNLNLKDIYEARLKLEGMGLLKTFVQAREDSQFFIYELQPPLSPEQFFLDGMLNVYLYRKIGKNQFSKVKQFFSDKALSSHEGYEDVTTAFQDVYQSAVPSSNQYSSEHAEDLYELGNQIFVGRTTSKGIQVDLVNFDFDLFFAGLSDSLVPKKAVNQKVKEAISNLSYLYGIDAIHMKNLVIDAMDLANNEVNIEELRKAARDWYQLESNEQYPLLVDKLQPIFLQSEISEPPKTKEEQFIFYLDTTSPRQFLTDISGGTKATKQDLQIIEDVMFNQKLSPGVVNVLIHYVLLKTDMKLTKGYVEKIASHWARKRITTVKEAMDLAIKEHRQYLEWAENKKNPKPTPASRKKPIRTEALPDWFDEKETDQKSEPKGPQDPAVLEEKKRALEERLKKYKK